jgi:hypothetical protein
MYASIDVDFDVWKAITNRRRTPETTENDVLRELLELGNATVAAVQPSGVPQKMSGAPWVSKGVTFPHGTEFRAEYRGRRYLAQVDDGQLVYDGQKFKTPSQAAGAVTGNAVNGWNFWECKMPGKSSWVRISELRNK